MGVTFKVEGLRDLDKALGELSKATARAVVRRALVKAAEPIADRARQLVPVATGKLRDSITVDTKFANREGKAAFAKVMKAGGSKGDAVSAMRDAQRGADGGSFVSVAVGPGRIRYASLVEYGSAAHSLFPRDRKDGVLAFQSGGETAYATEAQHPGASPHPYMRPAWEAGKRQAMDDLKAQLAIELEKARVRAAARAAKKR